MKKSQPRNVFQEVARKFGEASLTTETGRDWTVQGTHKEGDYLFTIGPAHFEQESPGYYRVSPGFPYLGVLQRAGRTVTRAGITPNPHRLPGVYSRRDADVISPGEPEASLACSFALGVHKLLEKAMNEIDTRPDVGNDQQ